MEEKVSFLKRKDIEISAKRYLQDALSAMALGLFGSLLIGVIFDTLGTQTANLFGDNAVSAFCVEIGGIAYEAESITDPIPEGTPHGRVDAFVRRGTIFLMVDDYLKMQHRLQGIYHRLEVLNPKVAA